MSEREPITGELREAVEWEPTFCGPDKAMVTFEGYEDYVTDKNDGMAELRAAWNRRADHD